MSYDYKRKFIVDPDYNNLIDDIDTVRRLRNKATDQMTKDCLYKLWYILTVSKHRWAIGSKEDYLQ